MADDNALTDGVVGSAQQSEGMSPAAVPAPRFPAVDKEIAPSRAEEAQWEAAEYPEDLLQSYRQVFEEFWNPASSGSRRLQKVIQTFQESIGAPRYARAVQTFIANVEAIRSLLGFPFLLSGLAVHAGFHSHDAASDSGGSRPLDSHEFMQALVSCVLRPEVRQGLGLLSQQAIVLLWGAYETLTRDIFVAALNANPGLYKALEQSALKQRFPPSSFASVDVLRSHGFDISHSLGSILAEGKDFSSPWVLEQLLSVLFQDALQGEELKRTLKSKELRLLGYRRHLVAHRLGIVDARYLRDTGDTQPLGEPLVVRGDDLSAAFLAVLETALVALACALQLENGANS